MPQSSPRLIYSYCTSYGYVLRVQHGEPAALRRRPQFAGAIFFQKRLKSRANGAETFHMRGGKFSRPCATIQFDPGGSSMQYSRVVLSAFAVAALLGAS